jgi:hypothetical protein
MITAYAVTAIPLQGQLAIVDLLGPVAWFAVAAVGLTLLAITALAARDHADHRDNVRPGAHEPAGPRLAA